MIPFLMSFIAFCALRVPFYDAVYVILKFLRLEERINPIKQIKCNLLFVFYDFPNFFVSLAFEL